MRYFLTLVFAALLFVGCDKCKDITCENGGSCLEGICECPTGFTGTTCEVEDVCLSGSLVCQNDGECVNGECDCERGFSGDECEEEDKCITDDVDCENGGDCDDGECICLAAFYGDECQFLHRTKFLGDYLVDEECDITGSNFYSSSIETAPSNANIEITSFWGVFTNNVTANVAGNNFTIPLQEPDNDGFTVQGSGSYDVFTDRIGISFVVQSPNGDAIQCDVLYYQ